MPIRVLIADDHTLVRAGVRSLISTMAGIEVVAEANDGREALQMIAETKPDVALIDITMAGMNGLEAAERMRKEFSGLRIIILSMHSNEEYVLQSLRVGAAGYLLKDASASELESAVRSVARGETFLSPAVSKHVISNYLRRAEGEDRRLESGKTIFDQLTPRQREILQLIAEGNTTQEVATRIGISVKTVETHRAQLMARLDIHETAGLVRYAIRMGLVNPEK
jgi:DNA-binding NarL/FixJ family response regulator